MTDVLVDKYFDTEGTSSAINAVYYSTDEQKIFFEFVNSGSLAGYQGVNPDIYTALETLNNNRLNGDESASVGGYYNRFFRNTGYFEGVETADIDILTPEDVARLDKLRNLALKSEDVFADEGINLSEEEQASEPQVLEGNVFVAPAEQPLRRFGISFVIDTDQQHNWNVAGTDEDDAINRFAQAVALLGWSVEIKSITRYL